jgi:hypothetical protein
MLLSLSQSAAAALPAVAAALRLRCYHWCPCVGCKMQEAGRRSSRRRSADLAVDICGRRRLRRRRREQREEAAHGPAAPVRPPPPHRHACVCVVACAQPTVVQALRCSCGPTVEPCKVYVITVLLSPRFPLPERSHHRRPKLSMHGGGRGLLVAGRAGGRRRRSSL